MIVVLLVDNETGNMQFSLEGGTPEMGCQAMKIAIKQIEAQTGGIVQPAPPPPPRRPNVRETIILPTNGTMAQ